MACDDRPVLAGKQLEVSGKKLVDQLIDQSGVNHRNSNCLLPDKPTRNKDIAKQANQVKGNTLKNGSKPPVNKADIQMNEESAKTRLAEQAAGVHK